MTDIWFVVHQKNLWDIDNRLIGFWKNNQSDLIKVGDYVIYYRAGYKEIAGVFKVVQKGANLNRDFHDPDIVEKPIFQSRLELI
jgi:predicted RNA-binding protein